MSVSIRTGKNNSFVLISPLQRQSSDGGTTLNFWNHSPSLTMKQHINRMSAACYYQLRQLRQIRRRVGTEVTIQLVLELVTSRLDYCNSVLAALP